MMAKRPSYQCLEWRLAGGETGGGGGVICHGEKDNGENN